jgi:TPR repeat protein
MAARFRHLLLVLSNWAVVFLLGACNPVNTPPKTAQSEAEVNIPALRTKAEAGDPAAAARLARAYMTGQGVTNSYAEAAHWFRLAAEKGNPEAQAGLGELYEAGQGVPKNIAKALDYYRMAATNGHAGARYNLGFAYESGRGVPQDQTQAAKWFLLAAQQGDPLSQYDVGQRYALGVGLAVDRVEALKWLSLAAEQGQVDAARKRDEMRSQMTRQEVAEAKRRASAVTQVKTR